MAVVMWGKNTNKIITGCVGEADESMKNIPQRKSGEDTEAHRENIFPFRKLLREREGNAIPATILFHVTL